MTDAEGHGSVLPSVDVVIPTHDRPEFVRAAIDSVRTQQYGGRLRVIVVFDRNAPDESLATGDGVPVLVLRNERKPGLCGARNTGICASDAELVAFLDDDDRWLPGKLARQVELLTDRPDVPMAATSIRVEFRDSHTDRYAGTDAVTHDQLLESRMSMLHSSTFLLRRSALIGAVGLVDEDAPDGQNEDYELLLRYSLVAPIAHIDEPLVAVRWGSTSLFAQAWRSKLAGARWILQRHPDIAASAVGHARLLGQIAFAEAALGQRRRALGTAARGIRVRWREPRPYLAVLAALGVPPGGILGVLHHFGRGV
jgi:glycosyltransferase involved in cell wall biosynthesis